ncbi:MAG TPA: FRG domain-containing protein [Chloroflexota bacterium]|nr:FRG domain-containing protein [Chloroflexota bacterium]
MDGGLKEIRASNWTEVMSALFADSWQPQIGRFRSAAVYRGLSNASYGLSTSLARLGGRDLEAPMLRAFRKYAYNPMHADHSIWNWLALAQHHGLSTRLMDWSYSPLVALYFATRAVEAYDQDAVIWAVNPEATNRFLPSSLQCILQDEGSEVFTADMLERAAHDLRTFDALSREPFVAFFEPPSLDERIINQYALFSLVSDPNIHLDAWLGAHPETYRKVIIPAALKPEVRDKLDTANVTERVLFPGLDGLSRWLNRYYTPNPASGVALHSDQGAQDIPLRDQ